MNIKADRAGLNPGFMMVELLLEKLKLLFMAKPDIKPVGEVEQRFLPRLDLLYEARIE